MKILTHLKVLMTRIKWLKLKSWCKLQKRSNVRSSWQTEFWRKPRVQKQSLPKSKISGTIFYFHNYLEKMSNLKNIKNEKWLNQEFQCQSEDRRMRDQIQKRIYLKSPRLLIPDSLMFQNQFISSNPTQQKSIKNEWTSSHQNVEKNTIDSLLEKQIIHWYNH